MWRGREVVGAVGFALGLGCIAASTPDIARAHIELLSPPSRYGGSVLKDEPCGQARGTRTSLPTYHRSGTPLLVRWEEYIGHPGHFRIAFDPDGDDDFTVPPCLDNCDVDEEMDIANAPGEYTDSTVILDAIPDASGVYERMVNLPDIECNNCTLQVIQVMTDKAPYTTDAASDDIYFQCADLVLTRNPPPDAGVGGGGMTGGCSVGAASGAWGDASSVAILALAMLVFARARRRTR